MDEWQWNLYTYYVLLNSLNLNDYQGDKCSALLKMNGGEKASMCSKLIYFTYYDN